MKFRVKRIFLIIALASLILALVNFQSLEFDEGVYAMMSHFLEQLLGREAYLEESMRNICFNGSDTSLLNASQKLGLFRSGPCSPVVLIPGITSTGFQAKIDCELLRDENPEIFADCGWETCDWHLWRSSPKPEYRFWVPDYFSPMTAVSPFKRHSRCWGHFVKLIRNESEPDPTKRFVSPKGIKIEFLGNTEQTRDLFNCGAGAIADLFPGPRALRPRLSVAYAKVIKLLEHMGYQSGITMMPMPYDFRIAAPHNDLQYTLERTIRLSHKITAKKVMVVAHSYSSISMFHLLSKLSQAEKDELIERVISTFPPFGGSTKGIKEQVAGEESLYPKGMIGLDIFAQKMYLGTSSAMHDIFPRDFFFKFQNESWMRDIRKRMTMEEAGYSESQAEELPFKWFPNNTNVCASGFVARKDETCGLHIADMHKIPVAIIKNQSFYAKEEDIDFLLKNYVLTGPNPTTLYNDARLSEFYLLKNPGVKLTVVYGAFHNTDSTVEFDNDPRITMQNDILYIPDRTTYTLGDNTVSVASSLVPTLKWAWEYDNLNQSVLTNDTVPKPVQIVEYCSIFGGNMSGIHSTNSYYGLKCECQTHLENRSKKVKGVPCQHSKCLADDNLVKFLGNYFLLGAKIKLSPKIDYSEDFDDLIESMLSKCPHLNAPRHLQTPNELLDFTRI